MSIPLLSDSELQKSFDASRPLHWEHGKRLLRRAQIAEAALSALCDNCPYYVPSDQREAGRFTTAVDKDDEA